MLLHQLKEIEIALERRGDSDLEQLKTASALKNLLLQIDYKTEHISDLSLDRIIALLTHLKGESLSAEEKTLVETIFFNPHN